MSDRYTYRVTWSQEDESHVGLCVEFPSLSWISSTPDGAFSGIRNLVSDILADMEKSGEPPPEPISDREYSGKFLVRVPPAIHRSLVPSCSRGGYQP